MKTITLLIGVSMVLGGAFAQQAGPREEWFRGLELEEAASRAELILAARIEEVSEIRLVFGGKGESSIQQYRLNPLHVLKGVFARPELVLTSSDLGGFHGGGREQLRAGQMRLLFLGRTDVGYCNVGNRDGSLEQALPPLANENDPLLQCVTDLLAMRAEPDRNKRAALLAAALARHTGPATVPLLAALAARSLPAAQQPEAIPAIIRHLGDASPAVRAAAATALKTVLAADYLNHDDRRDAAATALTATFASGVRQVAMRTALVAALGELQTINSEALAVQLDFEKPTSSLAERAARIEAVGKLRLAASVEKLATLSQSTPLDSPQDAAIELALTRIDTARGSAEIVRRAEEKIAAGLGCVSELRVVATLPPEIAAPLLVRLAALPLNAAENLAFAQAAFTVCEKKPDERLVAPLSKLLSPEEPARESASEALLRIGTAAAAEALKPRLAQEQNLHRKLRIAELLGKHGGRDGYAYAIEHVSDPSLTEVAVAALAAIKDPRTAEEMKRILETSNDAGWNRAAIRVLGALGAKELAPKFSGYVSNWKNPQAIAALLALADLGDPQVLPRISEALNARGDEIMIAGTHAASRLLAQPAINGDAVRDQLAALLDDSTASEPARSAALDALEALKDPRLDRALALADADATLEGTNLLARVERLMIERKVKLP
jgi:HEAT repeat protein